YPLQDDGRGEVGGDAVGNGHELVARGRELLGVAAGDVDPGDALPVRGDRPRTLDADDCRRRRAVAPSDSLVDVTEVDADGLDVDEHLAVARDRVGSGRRVEHLR